MAGRLNLAATELNPFLIVVAIGLMILNLILYLGMSVSQHPPAWITSHSYSAPAAASPSEPTAAAVGN